jgi:predicted dehydrogenase
MRFALLGTHPDGLAMASALVASGRHELTAFTAQSEGPSALSRWATTARPVADLEEVLADPAIEGVIVAGIPSNRPAQLRRALQSERHVLCVYPPDRTPDVAYEAAMIQADTRRVLFPLLPDALHAALLRMATLGRPPSNQIGDLRLLAVEDCSANEFLLEPSEILVKWALPGWDRLRALGGEIREVSGLSPQEDLELGQPLLLSGVFEHGGLFQVSFVANARSPRWRATAMGDRGQMELLFPVGWQGPAFLTWRDESGELREEAFPPWDPWPLLVEAFEAGVGERPVTKDERISNEQLPMASTEYSVLRTQYSAQPTIVPTMPQLIRSPAWQDVIRCLELDDAARRSVAKRRTSTLEFPEATEETGFKGTMTLIGCGLFWVILLLLVLSAWKPWLGWFIVPVLVIFLLLQGLRWIVRRPRD